MPCRISRLASTASLNRLAQLTAADQDREPEGRKRNIRKRATAKYHILRFPARVCMGSAFLRRFEIRLVGVFEPAAGGGLRGACKRPGKSGASHFVWIGKARQVESWPPLCPPPDAASQTCVGLAFSNCRPFAPRPLDRKERDAPIARSGKILGGLGPDGWAARRPVRARERRAGRRLPRRAFAKKKWMDGPRGAI